MKRQVLTLALVAVVMAAGVMGLAIRALTGDDPPPDTASSTAPLVADVAAVAASAAPLEVHRSETCGCCGGHVEHLREAGFEVEEVVHPEGDEVERMKTERGIPTSMWSCHTTLAAGYAVEGHVPAEAIAALLSQGPDVDGIALPGMPVGSPGMDGPQQEPFVLSAFMDGRDAGVFAELPVR